MENKKEFTAVFQLSKKEIFEVCFYTLGSNKNPYFSTSAMVFNQPKTDYNRCGQCQESVTKKHPAARRFYEKWDKYHLKDMTPEVYDEMVGDLLKLVNTYNYLAVDCSRNTLPFGRIVSLSMLKPKQSYANKVYWQKMIDKENLAYNECFCVWPF